MLIRTRRVLRSSTMSCDNCGVVVLRRSESVRWAGVMGQLWGPPSRYGGFVRVRLAGRAARYRTSAAPRINQPLVPQMNRSQGRKERTKNQKSSASPTPSGDPGPIAETPDPCPIRPSPISHRYPPLGLVPRGGICRVRSYPALGLLIGFVPPRRSRRSQGPLFLSVFSGIGVLRSVEWARETFSLFGSLLPRSIIRAGGSLKVIRQASRGGYPLRGQTSTAPAPTPRPSHIPSHQPAIPRSTLTERFYPLGAPKTEDRAEMG